MSDVGDRSSFFSILVHQLATCGDHFCKGVERFENHDYDD